LAGKADFAKLLYKPVANGRIMRKGLTLCLHHISGQCFKSFADQQHPDLTRATPSSTQQHESATLFAIPNICSIRLTPIRSELSLRPYRRGSALLPGLQLAGKALISPAQLRNQLKGLAEQRILAVLVIDLLDCSGSFLSRVRDLVGRNPVLLIGTKVS